MVISWSWSYGSWIQHYVKKFVSDIRQVGGFLRVLRFPSPVKLTATIQLKHHNPNQINIETLLFGNDMYWPN